MKLLGKILAGAAILGAGISTSAFAQATDTEATDSSVTILQGIALTKVTDLSFGRIVRPSSGSSTITMALGSDTPTVDTGDAVVLASGTKNRASYTATGEGGQAFTITVPATVSMTGPGTAIVVSLTKSLASGNFTGSLGSAGALPGGGTLYVGGSFSLPTGQASGAYTGSFDTTIAYN